MDIQNTKPVRSAANTGKAAAQRRVESAGATQAAAEVDPLTIAGIGEAELTPKLHQAITGLLAEVSQLQRDLGAARARIGYLERLADEDPLIPVANRRAFVRELTRMMSFTQRYNVRNSDVVGRLGGDELGVLLVQADQELAEQKAAQLAAAVAAQPLQWQGQSIPLGVSYGVYSFNGGENAGDAIDAADRAMYAAKRQRTRAQGPP